MRSMTIESCVLQLSVALRQRNGEADHILRAHKTRMSAGASNMTRRAAKVDGDLTQVVFKAAKMNGRQEA